MKLVTQALSSDWIGCSLFISFSQKVEIEVLNGWKGYIQLVGVSLENPFSSCNLAECLMCELQETLSPFFMNRFLHYTRMKGYSSRGFLGTCSLRKLFACCVTARELLGLVHVAEYFVESLCFCLPAAAVM